MKFFYVPKLETSICSYRPETYGNLATILGRWQLSRMHYKPANESDEKAKRLIARPKFKVNEIDRGFDLYTSNHTEQVCTIQRVDSNDQDKVGHYLFKNVEKSFIVSIGSHWVPHPFLHMNENRQFKVLAESTTYQIVELGFIIGCLFDLSTKNPNHLNMLKNFMLKMAVEVRCKNYTTKPLAPKLEKEERKVMLAQDEIGFAIYEEYTRRLEHQVKSGADLSTLEAELGKPIDVYKHSGLAIRKDRMAKTSAQNSINRYPTVREYGGMPHDAAFLKTQDKQSIKRQSLVYREKVREAYSKCYPENSKERSKTTDNSNKNQSKNKPDLDDDKQNPLSLDISEIKVPKQNDYQEELKDKKIFSYKVHSFVEREYVRRNTQQLKRENRKLKMQKKAQITNSNDHITKSHNSSHEKSSVGHYN